MSNPATTIAITGWGAVSPAGWGVGCMHDAVLAGKPLASSRQRRADDAPETTTLSVPPPAQPLSFARDPRLRRVSPISRYATAAALEAVGPERLEKVKAGEMRVGVIYAIFNGCVNYSRRFYSEVLTDPATASPIVFPETVFNAPASHLSALLVSPEMNYTLVGDTAQFISALQCAAEWLEDDLADGVVVVAAEELDWLSQEGACLFDRSLVVSEGAGALFLEKQGTAPVRLNHLTSPIVYSGRKSRHQATRELRGALTSTKGALLCSGLSGSEKSDAAERRAFVDWDGPILNAGQILGDGLGARVAWQCVLAANSLATGRASSAVIPAIGNNFQAAAAIFCRLQNEISVA